MSGFASRPPSAARPWRLWAAAPLALVALGAAAADAPPPSGVVVAARAVPSRTVLAPGDLALAPLAAPGALAEMAQAIGLETQVALYPGRPVRPEDLAPPALVERNDIVTLVWRRGAVVIRVEGRALDRAGVGGRVRAMNLGSRSTVIGRVVASGLVEVGR